MDIQNLIQEALNAREKSYCPYSGYAVGAALLTKQGEIIKGCNIENAAYGPSNCAERTAIFKAVSEGIYDFEAIAVVGGAKGKMPESYADPCGVCRQVMREFCSGDFKVITAISTDEYKINTLEELLPNSFGPDNLK